MCIYVYIHTCICMYYFNITVDRLTRGYHTIIYKSTYINFISRVTLIQMKYN